MIPWASPSLLASNPTFEQLHKRLVTDILDHDCTTRRRRRQQQQQDQPSVVVSERLTAYRVSLAREQLLAAVLFDLALGDDHDDGVPLSKDVREASLTIATYLYRHGHLSRSGGGAQQQQQQLLLPLLLSDVSTLRSNKPGLSDRILAQYAVLKDIATALASTASTSTITSTPSQRPQLSDLVSRQLKQLQEVQTQTLPRARYGVANSAVALLRAQAEEMEWLVRWLEQRRHGAEGRYVAGRARWLGGVARGMAAKARVGYLEGWRDGDDGNGNGNEEGWRQKVRRKMDQLEEEERELERRKSQLSEVLVEYDDEEGIMEQLGKRYAEIESEIDQVKADVERLSSRSPQWVPP